MWANHIGVPKNKTIESSDYFKLGTWLLVNWRRLSEEPTKFPLLPSWIAHVQPDAWWIGWEFNTGKAGEECLACDFPCIFSKIYLLNKGFHAIEDAIRALVPVSVEPRIKKNSFSSNNAATTIRCYKRYVLGPLRFVALYKKVIYTTVYREVCPLRIHCP